MKLTHRLPGLRRILTTLAALAAAWALAGCVYRPNIQQGNLLQIEDIEQVKPGMTRSQVRYVLGTPMVSDPFEPQRWDYVYTFRQGRSKHVDRAHFTVYFEGDKVSHVEKLDMPEETETSKVIKQQREAQAASEAAAAAKAGQAPGSSPPAATTPPAAPAPTAPAPEAPPPATPPGTAQPPGGG